MTSSRHTAPAIGDVLSGVRLFAGIGDRSFRALSQTCRLRFIEKGEILFFQTDPAEAAYVLHSGRISILISNADGRFLVLDDMRPGDLFGELGVLTAQPHSASALARSDTELLVIPRATFLKVMDDEAHVARRVLDLTARRLQNSVQRAQAMAFMNAQARLARYLLGLADLELENGYITASQDDLANGIGLIRQTVAKALGEWRREGWLKTSRGRIIILNRKALEAVEQGLPG